MNHLSSLLFLDSSRIYNSGRSVWKPNPGLGKPQNFLWKQSKVCLLSEPEFPPWFILLRLTSNNALQIFMTSTHQVILARLFIRPLLLLVVRNTSRLILHLTLDEHHPRTRLSSIQEEPSPGNTCFLPFTIILSHLPVIRNTT